jgi:F420-non-reducing hydrogenase iron-sulfur subunit
MTWRRGKGIKRTWKGFSLEMNLNQSCTLALFYCQNVPGSNDEDRQALEHKYGPGIRLFPIPCSGRLEPLHMLRALEEFADAVYVVTCPEGACRYFEGNRRAIKRVERTRSIISGIGLERERLGIIVGRKPAPKTLTEVAEEILDRISGMGPSPIFKRVRST